MQITVDPNAWKVAPDRTEGRASYYFQGMFGCVDLTTNKALPFEQRPEFCFMAVGRMFNRANGEIQTLIELFTDRSFNNIYTIEDGWLVLQRENYNFEHNVFQALYDLALLQQNYDKGDANKGKAEPLVGPNSLHKRVMRIEELISREYRHGDSIMVNHQNNNFAEQCADRLKHSRNLILTGAPGTGKTHLAREIAQAMNQGIELSDDDRKNTVGFVQFHPSYDYVDFVEGLRPTKSVDGKNVIFERRDGVFKEFCKQAIVKPQTLGSGGNDNFDKAWESFKKAFLNKDDGVITIKTLHEKDLPLRLSGDTLIRNIDTEYRFTKSQCYLKYKGQLVWHKRYMQAIINYMKDNFELIDYKTGEKSSSTPINYVFIIDEINRGDLSKIFGELFFAIDPGYRGEKGRVKTQYQQLVDAEEDDAFSGEGFYVPDNVYIIGTMNDIDRSVESMDFALRRRFAWKKISPEDTAESMGITGEVRQRMDAMNKAICSIPELGEDYQIGGAYFLKMVKEDLSAEDLWDFHLKSLIDEYLRGLPNKDELYKKIKNAYDNPRKTNDETKPQENSTKD